MLYSVVSETPSPVPRLTCRASERDTNLLHLTGTDIVGSNNETFWVFLEQFLEKHSDLFHKNLSNVGKYCRNIKNI